MRQIRGASLSLAIVAGVLLCGCFAPKPEPSAGPSVSVRSTPLDLDAVGNVKLADFGGLPTGDQTFDGVAYRVGQSGLRVGSRSFPNIPLSAGGVPVGRSFRVARFLHATSGGGYQEPGHPKHEADGVHVADYVIRYEDGTSETFPLRYGQELRDWWNWDSSKATTNAEVGWTGQNPEAAKFGVDVRLFATSWQNPHPEKKVATIDLVSANASAAPFCVAITVDDDPNFTPAPVASPISPPKRPELYDPPRPAPSFEIASAPRERPASSAAAVEPSPPPSSVPSQPSPPPEAKSSPKTPPVAAPPSTESDEGVPTGAPRD